MRLLECPTPLPAATRWGVRLLLALAAAGFCTASVVRGQPLDRRRDEPSNYPPALPGRTGSPPPPLAFRVVGSVPLPGRFTNGDPEWTPEGVRVTVDGVPMVVRVENGSSSDIVPSAAPSDAPGAGADEWVLSADGRRRVRTAPHGSVEAQKRCRTCSAGWKREWTLRVAGATRAAPLIVGRRLFFAALDDRVYCLRADNGHRVWAVDVGDRVSRPLAFWSGSVPAASDGEEESDPIRLDLLLVAPDAGANLLALDPFDGSRVAVFDLPPSEGRLATGPLALPDGTVAVGREKYADGDSELVLLSLSQAPQIDSGTRPAASNAPGSTYDKVSRSVGGR